MNEHHKNHKLMWNELSRTGKRCKSETRTKLGLPKVQDNCFACENAGISFLCYDNCKKCPLKWVKTPVGLIQCLDPPSPYLKWHRAKTPRTRKKYAKIIANMKWRTKK